jgi:protein phosphatase-4 regulatory subunit 3
MLSRSSRVRARHLSGPRDGKQQSFANGLETLIVWTELSSGAAVGSGTDMALSFQEPDGCAAIWEVIESIQQIFEPPMGGESW